MLTRENRLILALLTLTLGACVNKTPITLTGKTFHLVSMDKWESKYKEVSCQFKENQTVEIFAVTDYQPMYGDVTIGGYKLKNNVIELPKIGVLTIQTGKDGFDLYAADGKLKYKLTRQSRPYIRPGAVAPRNRPKLTISIGQIPSGERI